MIARIAILAGDGIGPEVIAAALTVLDAALEGGPLTVELDAHPVGGAAIDACGEPLPAATLAACRNADAVLLGAVGGPRWNRAARRPEEGLLELRQALGLFANLRPTCVLEGFEAFSPLRREVVAGTDLLIVRELAGGLYFGPRGVTREGERAAFDTLPYRESEIRRVAEVAFRAARGRRGRVTSVDKANVLATSRLWREIVAEVAATNPEIECEHALVDSVAYRLVARPSEFDVLLTENLFGDILSDQAAALSGSLGLAPSASIGEGGSALYEPVHGSAPDLAGAGVANPVGAILSAAWMLRDTFQLPEAADAIAHAVAEAARRGVVTPDLGGRASISEATDEIARLVRTPLPHNAARSRQPCALETR